MPTEGIEARYSALAGLDIPRKRLRDRRVSATVPKAVARSTL